MKLKRNTNIANLGAKSENNVTDKMEFVNLYEDRKPQGTSAKVLTQKHTEKYLTHKNAKKEVKENLVTSTPTLKSVDNSIKSIMKKSIDKETSFERILKDTLPSEYGKRKKRNKSVSFRLEDKEDIVVKKSKTDDNVGHNKAVNKNEKKKEKQFDIDDKFNKNKKFRKNRNILNEDNMGSKNETVNSLTDNSDKSVRIKNKPRRKDKNVSDNISKTQISNDSKENVSTQENSTNPSGKLPKEINVKKTNGKHKTANVVDRVDGEPQGKTRKRDIKVIAKDLENMKIAENAHTVSDLLNKMTVVDKKKRNKRKDKIFTEGPVSSNSQTPDLDNIDEGVEKVKWTKRKWNKDKKGEISNEHISTTVIVENLPTKIMTTYKTLLTDYFNKCGQIIKIGLAQAYITQEPNNLFATTIQFANEDAALQALKEDKAELDGTIMCVKRPLPATQITAVVRSYADLNEKLVSSTFLSCGRIRSIKQIVKGKKAISTVFVQFDDPDSVEKAVQMAVDTKIGGKKMFVSRYEERRK